MPPCLRVRLIMTEKGGKRRMKAIKASKKLISAIISFVLSLVLCVGVCLAWYSANNKVGAGNPSVGLVEGDIISFTVKAYYLDSVTGGYKKAPTGNVVGTGGFLTGAENVDKNSNGSLEDDDKMRPYGGIGNTFATAVLFEIEYELRTSQTSYKIFASCPTSSKLDVEDSDQDDTYTSGLSNAVGYYGVNESGGTYSKSGDTATRFVQIDNTKTNVVVLKKDIVPSEVNNDKGNHTGKVYVIMDYLPENFIYLSSLIIRSGGTLTSGLELTGDLSINITSGDLDVPDIPDVPDPDETVNVTGVTLNKNTLELTEEGTETLRATVVPSNATDKTVTWTTSDATVATVSNGKVTAVGAGTATITVTTTDGEKTATCAVTVTSQQSGETTQTYSYSVANYKIVTSENATGTIVVSGQKDTTIAEGKDSDNSGDIKFDSNAYTVTITVDAKAGQNVSVKLIGYSGSSGNAVGANVEADNATMTSESKEIVFSASSSNSAREDGTVEFVVTADGEVSITIKRSKGNTTRVTGIEVTVG